MKSLTIVIFLLLTSAILHAQERSKEKSLYILEVLIENLAENFEEEEVDYTALIENIEYLIENPVNINTASTEELQDLFFLNDFQILHLQEYIKKFGGFITIYELPMIEGFTTELAQAIEPLISFGQVARNKQLSFNEIFKYGKGQLFIRYKRNLEEQKGYNAISDSAYYINPNSRYLGSQDKIYTRFKYNFRDRVKFGFTAEKDAGEAFFKNQINDSVFKTLNDQFHKGFDFYSAHLSLQDFGYLKNLTIGDYALQFGQGLTLWSGLAFGKMPYPTKITKRAKGIKPYTSVDENNFFRGAAATVDFNSLAFTAFFSSNKKDANLIANDSLSNEELFISSLQETGFHRKPSEILDKDAVTENLWGGHLSYKKAYFELGLTGLSVSYDAFLDKTTYPYNQFEFRGNNNANYGFDYKFLIKNF